MRLTRAALRAQAHDEPELNPTDIHEDVEGDATLKSNRNSEESGGEPDLGLSRPALKDITHENYVNADDATNENDTSIEDITHQNQGTMHDGIVVDEQPVPTKKTRSKQKGKQSKKERIEAKEQRGEDTNTESRAEGHIEDNRREVAGEEPSCNADTSAEEVNHQEQPQDLEPPRAAPEEPDSNDASVSSEGANDGEQLEVPPHSLPEETESNDTSISSEAVNGPTAFGTEVTVQLSRGEEVVDASESEQPFQNSTSTPPNTLQESTSTPEAMRSDPPKTPRFDPSIHAPHEDIATPPADTAEDSFVGKIKSRSPSKMQTHPEPEPSDSFVEDIITRTPRIEDSVEAIDALEDAIERVSEDLPVLDGLQIESPVKSRKNTPARQPTQPITSLPGTLKKTRQSPTKNPQVSPPKTTIVARPSSRPSSTAARAPAPKPASKAAAVTRQAKKPIIDGSKPRESTASSLPPLSFSHSPSNALPNTSQKRVPSNNTRLSTAKPAFVPAKSSKPPTKPTFTLPGEAISAKLKAQREERLRREEEAEKERKQFKARPVPTKTSRPSVLPRENRASQARMSLYASGVNKENIAPKRASAPIAAADPKPRPSSICAKPTSDQTRANSSVRRATSALDRATTAKPRVSSLQLAAGQKSTVTKDDAVHQKLKGREVFSRTKAEQERLEKERKEKEEATRKARAAAAERGRQASREWAEKQKKKLMMQAAAAKGTVSGTAKAGDAQSTSTAVPA